MNVLEIGAGAGTLTSIICEKARKVVSYEIDNNLKPILDENLKELMDRKKLIIRLEIEKYIIFLVV